MSETGATDALEAGAASEDVAVEPAPEAAAIWQQRYRGLRFAANFKWLAMGALLYALLLLVAMAGRPGDATIPVLGPSLYLTPFFGLPYVLASINLPGRTRRIFYFIVLLLPVHIAANYAAWSYGVAHYGLIDHSRDFENNFVAGAMGGAAGSVLSFALLYAVQLTPPGRRSGLTMAVGVILLSALGGAAMALGLRISGAAEAGSGNPGPAIIWYETVHLPWQLLFALILAWLMRITPEPAVKAATD